MAPVRLEPATPRSRVKQSTTDPLRYIKMDEITAIFYFTSIERTADIWFRNICSSYNLSNLSLAAALTRPIMSNFNSRHSLYKTDK